MIRRWLKKRQINALESQLYWLKAEFAGLSPSPYAALLAVAIDDKEGELEAITQIEDQESTK